MVTHGWYARGAIGAWAFLPHGEDKNHQGGWLAGGYWMGMHEKPVALVTGANQGIGLAIATDLAARGFTVLVGSRDLARDQAAAAEIAGDARAIALDVTNAESIAGAENRVREELGRLDVLVNNAGIANGGAARATTLETILESGCPSRAAISDIRAVFETNVFGVIAVTQAMLPLLRQAPAARVVNVSSRVGSMTVISDPAYPMRRIGGVAYGPSKSALNAVTIAFAQELEGTAVKVNAMCPGLTATAFNDHLGTRSAADGAREAVRLALLGPDGPTGTFSNDAGPIPW